MSSKQRPICSLWPLISLVLLAPIMAAAEESRHYDWLTAGKISGSHDLLIRDDGLRVTDLEYNDRGRGPKIHEELMAGDDGILTSLAVTGHSYMGAPVDESFMIENGIKRWRSALEQGDSRAAGFYWASEGTLEQLATLTRALLAAPSGQMKLLPAGRATVREVGRYKISPTGAAQRVTLYAVSGLDFTPRYIWLDEDRELFAVAGGSMGLAPRGLSQVLPELQEIQDRKEKEFHRQRAEELTQVLPDNWILRNVSVVDVESGELITGRLVVVSEGRILRIEEDRELNLPVYGDLQPKIIDGQGLILAPGLWDMHTHLSMESGLLHIAAGVTTARDLGNEPERLAEIRHAFAAGEVIGPHTTAAGFIDRKSPYSAPTSSLAESLEDALNMVRAYAGQGYPQIKIYSSIEPAWVKPLATEIHSSGMRLSGHIPSYMTAQQAVLDGFDEIQHINMLFLNFLAGPEDDTRTPLRFSLVADKAGDMNLGSSDVTDFIALLKEKGVVVDPTVTVFDSMFRHRSGELDPSYAMIADHMPPSIRRGMLAGEMDINDANAVRFSRSADALLEMIGKLHRAGVPLVAGTDAMPGFTLHRELELYQRAGISNADILKIATLESAKLSGKAAVSGSISVGKQADFVLLAANPLENISAVRQTVAVFKGDRWYDTARLYEAVGIKPFTR